MRKRSESKGARKLGPIDVAVTQSGIYEQVGPKQHKGVGMIGMGQGSEESGFREPMPEHAIKASQSRALKATQHQNLASSSFAARAVASRKVRSEEDPK